MICGTLGISLYQFYQIKKQPAHQSMLDIAEIIFQTCKTYLIQQGKFLLMLLVLIAIAISYYLLRREPRSRSRRRGRGGRGRTHQPDDDAGPGAAVFSIVGMGGSYAVAWYGIRVNTYANARTAFASLRGEPWDVVNIPLRAGMSIGLFLISLELVMMVIILLFVPSPDRRLLLPRLRHRRIARRLGPPHRRRHLHQDRRHRLRPDEDRLQRQGRRSAESGRHRRLHGRQRRRLGRPHGRRLRDLRRHRRRPDLVHHAGHYAENAGVENYLDLQAKLIVWIFAMRFLMDFMSGVSYFINQAISEAKYRGLKEFDFEEPLTRLIWIASILCITTSFGMSWLLIRDLSVVNGADTIAARRICGGNWPRSSVAARWRPC